MVKQIIIRWDDENLSFDLRSETPVSTKELIGALELVKLNFFEKRILPDAEVPNNLKRPITERREIEESARKVILGSETLSKRVLYALMSIDVERLDQLLRFSRSELCRLRNLGRKSMIEIDELLKKYGYNYSLLSPIWYQVLPYNRAQMSDGSDYKDFDSYQELAAFINKENKKLLEG